MRKLLIYPLGSHPPWRSWGRTGSVLKDLGLQRQQHICFPFSITQYTTARKTLFSTRYEVRVVSEHYFKKLMEKK